MCTASQQTSITTFIPFRTCRRRLSGADRSRGNLVMSSSTRCNSDRGEKSRCPNRLAFIGSSLRAVRRFLEQVHLTTRALSEHMLTADSMRVLLPGVRPTKFSRWRIQVGLQRRSESSSKIGCPNSRLILSSLSLGSTMCIGLEQGAMSLCVPKFCGPALLGFVERNATFRGI